GRQVADEDRSGVRLRVQVADHELDRAATEDPERQTDEAPERANERGLRKEDRAYVARRCANSLHDPDLARAFEHRHDHGVRDADGGHEQRHTTDPGKDAAEHSETL